jgi:hypothetical protein
VNEHDEPPEAVLPRALSDAMLLGQLEAVAHGGDSADYDYVVALACEAAERWADDQRDRVDTEPEPEELAAADRECTRLRTRLQLEIALVQGRPIGVGAVVHTRRCPVVERARREGFHGWVAVGKGSGRVCRFCANIEQRARA